MKSGLYIYDCINDLVFCSVSIVQCVVFFSKFQRYWNSANYLLMSLTFCFASSVLTTWYKVILIFSFFGNNFFFLQKNKVLTFPLIKQKLSQPLLKLLKICLKIITNMYWCYEREEIAIKNKMLECKVKYLNYM